MSEQIKSELIDILQARLPCLPGHGFDFEKTLLPNHRKSHTFDVTNGINIYKPEAPGIGGKILSGQDVTTIKTSLENYLRETQEATGECVPSWVAFDRKVLRFFAYFQEAVHERREEHFRVRKVEIFFYLEDDTIHVSEPKIENSGIPQGTLLRRHRIPKDASSTQHFTVTDLNVGNEITFYGRTFKINACDQFTKDFLTEMQIQVPENSEVPQDPYTLTRLELQARMKAKRPYQPQNALKQFLENDRKVLRFFGIWDDSTHKYGELHHVAIHYYLSDDTIEVRELLPTAKKEDLSDDHKMAQHTISFLKRGRIPKKLMICRQGMGGAPAEQEYFLDGDIVIGTVLHFYSRAFLVCDCDEFTKQFYTDKYGITSFAPIEYPSKKDLKLLEEKQEQTLIEPRLVGNIGQTILAPKPSFKNAMKYDGIILRFAAKMRSKDSFDEKRKFVISVYMADEAISVFEQNKSSSEGLGGKFLEKNRVRKHPYLDFYAPKDFFVGAEISLYGRIFDIIGIDDYAQHFIEQNPDIFNRI